MTAAAAPTTVATVRSSSTSELGSFHLSSCAGTLLSSVWLAAD